MAPAIMIDMNQITVSATARQAGRNVVHTVVRSDGGRVVRNTRRSAGHYAYAICRWDTACVHVASVGRERQREVVEGRVVRTGERIVIVKRWSNNAKATGMDFAVRVES
jgi:hypothetical protein